MAGFEDTKLWTLFAAKATEEQIAMVRALLRHAEALLDRVIETFPTYTLHNHVHAENVVHRMGDLLGDTDQLSALEGAMLLLAAYFHDIGMVFDPEQRAHLKDEEAFPEFLNKHPEAYIAVANSDDLPLDIAEWYCRWRHADRVYVYLRELDDALAWDDVLPLFEALGELCRSHNESVATLHDPKFTSNFGGECDLRFCALLLRLADILDFDRSRSPRSVYGFLKLSRREEPRKVASDVEWLKHTASKGFKFPPPPRASSYVLDFIAGPDEPSVEHDLREFLSTIEGELRECGAMLSSCSDRWRTFALPDRIDRGNIHSQGYKYGEHRFTLDRDQVLRLFMGESLYESPFDFVRELLQNAIDASRHREFFERSRGHGSFRADPIVVEDWVDADGYRWVRVTDSGMGMDESILVEFFLKVGESYYRSAAFRAETIRHHGDESFTPISRFGIGILSCFVIGDRIEVATRRGTAAPVRLSLTDLEGFYTLQVPEMLAAPMPGPDGDEPGYRRTAGTTIAVRLDARKESNPLDLGEIVEYTILASPVPIETAGVRSGGDPDVLVGSPWFEPVRIAFSEEQLADVERVLETRFPEGLALHIVPLDLTKHSPTPFFRGQMAGAYLSGVPRLTEAGRPSTLRDLGIHFAPGRAVVTAHIAVDIGGAAQSIDDWDSSRDGVALQMLEEDEYADQETLNRLRAARSAAVGAYERELDRPDSQLSHEFVFERPAFPPEIEKTLSEEPGRVRPMAWSHNGVRIPRARTELPFRLPDRLGPFPGLHAGGDQVGAFAYSDALRPDLSVSRNELRRLPWLLQSAANLAWYRAVREGTDDEVFVGGRNLVTVRAFDAGSATLGDLMRDPWLFEEGGWQAEPIIPTTRGYMSLTRLRTGLTLGKRIELKLPPRAAATGLDGEFAELCAAALLQLHAPPVWQWEETTNTWICLARAGTTPMHPALQLFPPLLFVAFEHSTVLASERAGGTVNLRHPFAQWLIEVAERLHQRYPGVLQVLRRELTAWYEAPHDQVGPIVAVLDRLHVLDEGLAPPRSIYPTAVDFE